MVYEIPTAAFRPGWGLAFNRLGIPGWKGATKISEVYDYTEFYAHLRALNARG